ncbi:MAG: hypothetical protein H0X30_15870 [Anaerolineae bacterium]|nr:hypothetical protein [Anaerolineae bacterium]
MAQPKNAIGGNVVIVVVTAAIFGDVGDISADGSAKAAAILMGACRRQDCQSVSSES